MINKEKELLQIDLCGRLPYGVKITDGSNVIEASPLICIGVFVCDGKWKPYLRPMSSMTEEEKEEYCALQDKFLQSSQYPVTDAYEIFDWLNKNMFDYRGLIPMGLALEAREGIYNIR